jgi:hypothetical protein
MFLSLSATIFPIVIARRPKADEAISIKISDYHWAKKVK